MRRRGLWVSEILEIYRKEASPEGEFCKENEETEKA